MQNNIVENKPSNGVNSYFVKEKTSKVFVDIEEQNAVLVNPYLLK